MTEEQWPLPARESAKARAALVENANLASPVELACVWLEKARKGSVQWSCDCDRDQLRYWHLRKRLRPLKHVLFVFYLGIAFVEEPGWCVNKRSTCPRSTDWWLVLVDMPQAQQFVMPYLLHSMAKCFLLLGISFRILLLKLSRGSTFKWTKWRIFQVGMLSAALLDATVIVFNEIGILPGSIRLQRLLRPLIFMASYKPLRQTVNCMLAAVPQFASLIVCLGVTIMGFSWVGLVLFQGTDEGQEHFYAYGPALSNMYILFTTANSPDAFTHAYHESRWNFVFFFVYLVISLYLFQSLIVAAVYDGYKDYLKDELRQFYEHRRTAVKEAFELLAETNEANKMVILKDSWFSFFLCYCNSFTSNTCNSPFSRNTSDAMGLHRAMLIYEVLEDDGDEDSEGLSLQKFRVLAEMLHDENFSVPYDEASAADRTTLSPEFALALFRARKLILEGVTVLGRVNITWDNLLDMVIFLDFAITVWATLLSIQARNGLLWAGGGIWNHAALLLTLIYFVELNLKLYVLGFQCFYSYRPFGVYDIINVYLLFVTEVVFWTMEETNTAIRVYMVAHMARYVRLLFELKPFQELAIFLKKLLPTYNKLGLILVVTFYLFAEVGQQAFGGMFREEDEKIQALAYGESGYWDLHFNDFPSSLVVLFVLLVVNNWFMIAEVYWVLTQTYTSVAYFVAFYIVTNLVVLNILMAFIIECFQTLGGELLETDQEVHKPRQAMLRRESVLLQVMMGEEAEAIAYQRPTKLARDMVDSKLKTVNKKLKKQKPSPHTPAAGALEHTKAPVTIELSTYM